MILTIMIASLVIIGTSTSPVWGAQLDAKLNPDADDSPFKMNYQKTVFIEYQDGGNLFDALRGHEWTVDGFADLSDPGVQKLMESLNAKIGTDGSQARITDLNVNYDFHLKGRNINTSVDYRVIIEGTISNYVITKDSQRTLVDLGWRALSTNDEIIIDGIEINIPLNMIKSQEPDAYTFFADTEVEDVLNRPLINADFILEQPMTNWHFLFDPTGITSDAGTFGLDESIAGKVISSWTMGESSLREGRQVERVFEAEIMSDKQYVVRSVQSSDQAHVAAIGFGALDILDGVEIAGITPTSPEGYATTSTGEFPVMIVYGMAGMAALGGTQTSASSGGYQTNRGEAQLKDDTSYQQTRSVYEESQQQSPPPPQAATPSAEEDAACGCAASVDMGSVCDCEMQGACLCDGTCRCGADICKEQVKSMS